MRFEQITSVQYQAISHTDNQNLQFFLNPLMPGGNKKVTHT